jgi:hypothetical protein
MTSRSGGDLPWSQQQMMKSFTPGEEPEVELALV